MYSLQSLTVKTKAKLNDIIVATQEKLNITFSEDFLFQIVSLCIRKCQICNKEEAYLPLMFETELSMKIQGEFYNYISGGANHVRNMPSDTMCFKVS